MRINNYPYHVREKCIIDSVNGLSIIPTDCSRTFQQMMKDLDYTISLIRNLSYHEMFEVLIKLNKSGIDNMKKHLFKEWDKSKVNIWDYRQIKQTLQYIDHDN